MDCYWFSGLTLRLFSAGWQSRAKYWEPAEHARSEISRIGEGVNGVFFWLLFTAVILACFFFYFEIAESPPHCCLLPLQPPRLALPPWTVPATSKKEKALLFSMDLCSATPLKCIQAGKISKKAHLGTCVSPRRSGDMLLSDTFLWDRPLSLPLEGSEDCSSACADLSR